MYRHFEVDIVSATKSRHDAEMWMLSKLVVKKLPRRLVVCVYSDVGWEKWYCTS